MRSGYLSIALTLIVGLIVGTPPASAAEPALPLPAKLVTLTRTAAPIREIVREITTQTGIAVELVQVDPAKVCDVDFQAIPVWTALDELAVKTASRIALSADGRQITLAPLPGLRPASSVDGPFRTVVKQIVCKRDYDTGVLITEVTLDCHWEPRLPVYRLDSEPTITTVTDDRGSKLAVTGNKTKVPPIGRRFTTVVRIPSVPRSATTLTRLQGSYTVTAAEKMLAFRFTDLLSKTPITQEQSGVKATLSPIQKHVGRWDVPFELAYPPSAIEFESYESALWLTENKLQLISPTGQTYAPANEDTREAPNKAFATYRFLDDAKGPPWQDRKGWSMVYETPTPLREYKVHFDFRDLPLP